MANIGSQRRHLLPCGVEALVLDTIPLGVQAQCESDPFSESPRHPCSTLTLGTAAQPATA